MEAEHRIRPRVVERTLVHFRQVLFARVDDLAIDVAHDNVLNGFPSQRFTHGGPLTAAERGTEGNVRSDPACRHDSKHTPCEPWL